MIPKNKINRELLLVFTLVEVILLLTFIPSSSYLIKQSEPVQNNFINAKEKKDFDFKSFLISLFSIKQIGIVSAQEDNFGACCIQTVNPQDGGYCQPIFPDDPEDICSEENTIPSSCESTSICQTGTCIDPETGICSTSSQLACEGEWENKDINSISECKLGCCEFGEEFEYSSESQCNVMSGGDYSFNADKSEASCRPLTENMGACLSEDGGCEFTTEIRCISGLGRDASNFYKNWLCTHPDLQTGCEPTEETTCGGDGKVYFIDSCEQQANVYDKDKVFDGTFDDSSEDSYWKVVASGDELCDLDLSDGASVAGCGNCNRDSGISTCSAESEVEGINANLGDYICRDMRCDIDEDGTFDKNSGESWCVYESYVGDSRDVVGSLHWLGSCVDGEVTYERGDNWRGRICAEKSQIENVGEISGGTLRFNEGWKCLLANGELKPYEYDDDGKKTGHGKTSEDNRELCLNTSSDCRIEQIRVDDYFKFDVCVPEYPKGFDTQVSKDDTSTDAANRQLAADVCNMATTTCATVWRKGLFNWRCVENCECLTKDFTDTMNNLCVSLGDCGSYVNIEGEYTDNIEAWSKSRLSNKYLDKVTVRNPNYKANANGNIRSSLVEAYKEFATDAMIGQGNLPEKIPNPEDREWIAENVEIESGTTSPGKVLQSVIKGGNFVGGIASVLILTKIGGAILAGTVANLWNPLGWVAAGSVLLTSALFAVSSVLGVGNTRTKNVNFECDLWQAPYSGDDCDKCSDNPDLPCTEYRCESLGTACRLKSNLYESQIPTCIAIEDDGNPPIINFANAVSDNVNIEYSENTNADGNTIGVTITDADFEGGWLVQNTPINISFKTQNSTGDDEYAQCKYTWERTEEVPESAEAIPGSYLGIQKSEFSVYHNDTIVIPPIYSSRVEDETGGDLETGRTGEMNMHIRCIDYSGNFNLNEYIINFKIIEGEDNFPAEITNFLPEDESYLEYGKTETNLQIALNEPAECRYSVNDENAEYSAMTDFVSCDDYDAEDDVARWYCSTQISDLTEPTNKVYIKCEDQPWICEKNSEEYPNPEEDPCEYDGRFTPDDRNINNENQVFTIHTTENPLEISSVTVVRKAIGDVAESPVVMDIDSYTPRIITSGEAPFSIVLQATTSGGAFNGNAICRYDYVEPNRGGDIFSGETGGTNHEQRDLNIFSSGNKNISITCEDAAGNADTQFAIFNVEIDDDAPKITRAYRDQSSGKLRISTDEEAKCYYHTSSCNFDFDDENVVSMTTLYSKEHSADWNAGIEYYIRCEDKWENPDSSGCTAVLSPTDLYN